MSALKELRALNRASAAKARRMRGQRFRLEVTWTQCLILQDATDDYAVDAGAGLSGPPAARLRALQRRLHTLTGEEMPPTPAARRASLRRLLKGRAK